MIICETPPGAPTGQRAALPPAGENDPPCDTDGGCAAGMPIWKVTEPDVNLFLIDRPLRYKASRGRSVSLNLFFKNRHADQNAADNSEAKIFSVGAHWHTPWRSYLEAVSGESSNFWLYIGDGSARKLTLDQIEYRTRGNLTQVSSTNILQFPNGARNVYGQTFIVAGVTRYFLTRQEDPHGNALQFQYTTDNDTIRLDQVIDVDNRSTSFEYAAGGVYSNLMTKVIGPHGLTNIMKYDSSGRLTNIVDVINLSSTMEYDSNTNLTALITPYGTNKYTYFSISNTMYAVKVAEKEVRKSLYVFYAEVDGGKVPTEYSSYRPNTTNASYFAVANLFDATNTHQRNSFVWGPRQYENLSDNVRTNLENGNFNVSNLTSSDYLIGRQKHWLKDSTGTNTGYTLSLTRDISPDGTLQGQIKWFDHAGKPAADTEGTMFLPCALAWRLPNSEPRFTCFYRNSLGHFTNKFDTYTSVNGTCQLRTNQYFYDSNGIDLIRQVRLLGSVSRQIKSNFYNSAHQVLTTHDALGQASVFSYNSNQQLVSVTTPGGLTRTNVYESSGTWSNFLASTVAIEINRTNSFTYSNGYVLTATDPRGLRVTQTRDGLGRLAQTLFPDGTSVNRTYNKLDLVKVVDRMGFTNQQVFNAFRQKTHAIDPRTNATTFSYCNCGTFDSVTDPSGKTTSFSYNLQGLRTATAFPSSGSVTNNYDLMKQLTNTIDSSGKGITNWHNNQGLLATVSNAFGCQQTITFDMEDNRTNICDANTVLNRYAYDELGRVLKRTDPNGQTETFGYSSLGVVGHTNQLGKGTSYGYDAAGRKTSETNANGDFTLYAYNPAGDLLSLTDAKGHSTSWAYDQYGRVTSKTNANGIETLRYQYDANERLTNRWSLAKGNTQYRYDSVGNLTNIVYSSSTAIVMKYDANNRLTNMVDAVGTTSFTYTDFGELLSEDGPWENDTINYSYTTNRLRSRLSLQQPNSSSWEQSYAYDLAGRLTNTTTPAGSFSYLFDESAHPQVRKLGFPNGAFITNNYDSLARLTGTYLKNSGNLVLNSHDYLYDDAGRRTRQTRTGGDYVDYTYDAIGQLMTANGTESGGTTKRMHEQFGYAYDSVGNLSYRTNGALLEPFKVDNLDQLTNFSRSGNLTVSGTTWGQATNVTVNGLVAIRYADSSFARTNMSLSDGTNLFTAVAQDSYGRTDTSSVSANLPATVGFAYDGNGNLITNGTSVLEYDDENQLIRFSEPNRWKSEFSYDGKMRRRLRREYDWQAGSWHLTQELRYLYDRNLVLQVRNAWNTPIESYTRGSALTQRLKGAGGIGALLAYSQLSSVQPIHAFYHSDGNGNITEMIDQKQLCVGRFVYEPDGQSLFNSSGFSYLNNWRYSSRELHERSDLIHYLYRYYVPRLGRWLSSDPRFEKGWSTAAHRRHVKGARLPFTFVRNDPIGNVDPLGLALWVCTRPVEGPPWCGRHAYVWDDRIDDRYNGDNDQDRSCGMEGSSGSGSSGNSNNSPGDAGPPAGTGDEGGTAYDNSNDVHCDVVPNSDGHEDDYRNCCQEHANDGIWCPFANDCHNAIDRCLIDAGIPAGDIPRHPRF